MPISIRTSPSGPEVVIDLNTDEIDNESNLSGVTLTDALNDLNTDEIANGSSIAGATLTDALEGFTTDDIANTSNVTGATLSDALDTIDDEIASLPPGIQDPSVLDFQLHFLGAQNVSGENGWGSLSGVNMTVSPSDPGSSEADHPGTTTVTALTTATGVVAAIFVGSSTGALALHQSFETLTRWRWQVKFTTSFENAIHIIGFGDTTTNGANNGLGGDACFFSYIPGTSPKWIINQVRSSGAVESVITTVADVALDTWYCLEAEKVNGAWQFFVNGVSVGTLTGGAAVPLGVCHAVAKFRATSTAVASRAVVYDECYWRQEVNVQSAFA